MLQSFFLTHIPRDPWDGEYAYRVLSRRKYELRSAGPDALDDTEDDLVHPVVIADGR